MRTMVFALLVALPACGVGAADVDPASNTEGEDLATLPAEGSAEAVGALRLVDDCATTLTTLDVNAGLLKGAATAIVKARDGADAVCGTADDFHFRALAEL